MYAGLWGYVQPLYSEPLLMFWVAVMVLIAYRFRDRPSRRRAAALGVVCGLLALTRSEQILVWPLLVAPLILAVKGIGWRRRIGWQALATLLMLVVLAPWTIFNLRALPAARAAVPQRRVRREHKAVAMKLSMARTPEQPTYFRDTLDRPVRATSDISTCDAPPMLEPSVANTEWFRDSSYAYTAHHLNRLPLVLVAGEGRAFRYTGFAPTGESGCSSGGSSTKAIWIGFAFLPFRGARVGRLGLLSYWLLLVPAVAGTIVLRRRRTPIYPLLAFVATVVITVATTFGETRYRAAAEVSIVLLAGVGIDAVLPRKPLAPTRIKIPLGWSATTT